MPTIEYTLSFENYLEMTQSRREKKDYKFATFSAISGFFCIAGGYLFLRLGYESFFPGGLLLASGLLFAFVGMILGFLARPRSVRPNIRRLEREYKLSFADNRKLEFDETGWNVFWREGQDLRPWSCLREIYDLETLLVLGTSTMYYWFPKSALESAGQLENLRRRAEEALTAKRELLFDLELRPSLPVYVLAQFSHNWRLYLLPRALSLAALTLIAYWAFSESSVSWIFLLLPLGWLFCEALFYIAKYFSEDWAESSERVEIMSDSSGYRTKKIRWIVEHKNILELKRIPGAYLAYFDAKTYVIIPTQSLSNEQRTQFEKTVTSQKARSGVATEHAA